MKKLLYALVVASFLAGCNSKGQATLPPTTTVAPPVETSTSDETVLKAPNVSATNYEIVPQAPVDFDPNEAVFHFTDAEIKAFNEFQKNGYDKVVFKGMEPLSVVKIWLQYGTMRLWEADYNMYNRESVMANGFDRQKAYNEYMIDKEQLESNPMPEDKRLSLKDMASIMFEELENSKFVQESDTKGYIYMKGHIIRDTDGTGETMSPEDLTQKPEATGELERDQDVKINVVKNSDGVWELMFPPFN